MRDKENELDWNEWQSFSEWQNNAHVPQTHGVYQVRACREKGVPKAINRCCGVDESGLLYIGEGQLDVRLGKLQYLGQSGSKFHHQFIRTFEYYRLNRIADRELTEVRWAETEHCKAIEQELIDAYCKEFGDLPPGNLKLGG